MKAAIRGTELYFDVDGSSLVPDGDRMTERPVLFLLHGGPGGDHTGFKSVVGRLRDVAQLIYVDHRGSGRSAPADPRTCTLDQNIQDVEALRAYLGLAKISILGSSYGGMVGQGYAIRHPDRISNLVLVGTAPSFRFIDDARRKVQEQGSDEQRRVCDWLWNGSFNSLDQLRQFHRAMGPWYSLRFDEEQFERGWQLGRNNFEQLNFGFSTFLREFDFTEQLHRITCPTLVLAGEQDWICAPQHGREIADGIPRAHFKLFAHSAHSIAKDEPEAFLAAVRGFLTYTE